MQQKLVFSATFLLATTLCNLAYAQDCPSPLPAKPTAAQMISCINEMQQEIGALKDELESRSSSNAPDQMEFISPAPFPRGWSTHGGEYEQNFEYAIDNNGIVHLRGLMTGCPSSEAIFTLPEGFRPAIRSVFGTIGGDGALNARVDVKPNGEVLYRYTPKCDSAHPWLTLDGISFKAEQ
ncbi:MAG: hypothetical protein AAFZ99_15440 [Pseudomonadota bacterium]